MSQRGSFVTEFVYCDECIDGLRRVLNTREKYLCCHDIPRPAGDAKRFFPIIAGKVGELYGDGELVVFDIELRDRIEAVICHPVRIAVLPEGKTPAETFTYEPRMARQTTAPGEADSVSRETAGEG